VMALRIFWKACDTLSASLTLKGRKDEMTINIHTSP
jgi:hypothetical protein